MMLNNFEPVIQKQKIFRLVTRNCIRCKHPFKTTKCGKICEDCNKQKGRKYPRKKVPPKDERCLGLRKDGRQCRNKKILGNYCTWHFQPVDEKVFISDKKD